MTNDKIQLVAVFTGDLVGSTNLTKAQIDAAFSLLENCAKRAEEWHGTSHSFSRHRGDGWQVILEHPKYVLRLAIIFRAALKSLGPEFDTYIGIADGKVDVSDQTDLNKRNDRVFIDSGRALEAVKSGPKLDIHMAYDSNSAEAAAITLADKIVSDWTPAQAEAITQMLINTSPPNYTKLAKILGKSRQTVTKTLTAAGLHSISIAINLMEQTDD
ncbi:hypothetical protein [Cognatishimia activa]|uniref:hypothetical protein n=1 Tax=Cognatishimia activa TaxID=1715691 RepID=UPI0022310388|nr:hypothetical protein [Cognatishimia activa]UZD92250.1 hypothetical protein M0D42_06470 [Cognatishimia activa]